MKNRPAVGVAVIIKKDNKVLLGKRLNAHGNGTWAFPGGHLEFNESVEFCAMREVMEETGLEIRHPVPTTFTNDLFISENKHYITLYVVAEYEKGTPEVKEPEKCEKWDWFEWNSLPEPRFQSLKNLLEKGFDPFDV